MSATPLYGRKIDIYGNYVYFPGYTIISHAIHPLPQALIDLVNYLSSSELKEYYSFLPDTSFHVTINPLDDVHDEHVSLLKSEQSKLSKHDTSLICTANRLNHRKGILIEVDFDINKNKSFENIIQNVRSNELKQANILRESTLGWHLTLAYQYKNIETNEINKRLDQIFENIPESSKNRFDIPLDHVQICHYNDMTKFTPI